MSASRQQSSPAESRSASFVTGSFPLSAHFPFAVCDALTGEERVRTEPLSRQNPGRLVGASGTITIAQFYFCDLSRYFLSRSSAAWLPSGSKAPFFERDTVTLPSDPTREKNLLNILLPPGRDCTVQTASESTCGKGLPSLPMGCPVTTHSKPGIQTTVVCTKLSFLPSGKSMFSNT